MRTTLILLLVFVFAGSPGAALPHFGLAPKVTIEPIPLSEPDQPIFDMGTVSATRGEFSDYLDRLTAFQTRYQRLQPTFAGHFELLRSVALTHPENVHHYIDAVESVRSQPRLYQFTVSQWIRGQLGIYARLRELLSEARENRTDRDPVAVAVLDFYQAGAKAALLEELITSGEIEPSFNGLQQFLQRRDLLAHRLIEIGPDRDSALTPPKEQERLKALWRTFRQDVARFVTTQSRCNTPPESPDDVLIEIGDKQITYAAYIAVFGATNGDAAGQAVARANCARMTHFYAMAHVADEVALAPSRLNKDIDVARNIFLMARQLVRKAAPTLIENGSANIESLTEVQRLLDTEHIDALRAWVLSGRAAGRATRQDYLFLDDAFIRRTQWQLKRVLFPKHSIHM